MPASPDGSDGSAGGDEANAGSVVDPAGVPVVAVAFHGEGWRTCTSYSGGAGASGLAIVQINTSSYDQVELK